MRKPVVDYKNLRLSNINSDEYKHLWLLLFWPIYGIAFQLTERLIPYEACTPIYTKLDDFIPFNELFVIPYMFWFVFIAGMVVYAGFYDIDTFKRYMKYIMITYSFAIIFYWIFPNCQELRPVEFERDNILTRFMADFYQFDTNTNVLPSIHAMGSIAVWEASLYSKNFKHIGWKIFFAVSTVLICMSTVFLKQHSILDVLAGIAVCVVAHFICFRKSKSGEKEKTIKSKIHKKRQSETAI